MSRKGNRGQTKRTVHSPQVSPKLYDCQKHGIQHGVGLGWKGKNICMECLWEFLESNCCVLTDFPGEKKDESS